MDTTIDKAGRLVIPKVLRDELGLRPGPVRVRADGAALRIEPIHGEEVEDQDGFLVIPVSGISLNDDDVQALRDAGQR
ncbi:MAG: AbrB/MazE/SpoVT family DNA-binding domain-containing protein [Actinomycetota bacterium]